MKSRANIRSHPLHPILVVFPIAFFIGTFAFDVLASLTGSNDFWQTGKYLEIAGIMSAILAAMPGIMDYIYTVPPKSSAKSRAGKHGLLNSSMLLLFIIAFIYRDRIDPVFILIIEAAGVILLTIAGWMGGTLVHRNRIGVDQRYANAGKWNEAYFKQTSGLIEVAKKDELEINQMKLLHLDERRIVLALTENGYVAFEDRCTHKGGSLAGGAMICGTVQCPWHGSQFKVENGEVKAGPAKERIRTYPLSQQDGKVFISI